MLVIDGSFGEGGGQILRSSLALSMVTGKPFRIDNIRARRPRPGLMRQHLTAVRAAAEICCAQLEGASLHSSRLDFRPGAVVPGEYKFSIGTAGSTTLVLQTVLPALLCAKGPSHLILEGGTHNPFAPPFDFLQKAYLPLINRMGPNVTATLERYGFAPGGGGRFQVHVAPAQSGELTGFDLMERGDITHRQATALVSNLPTQIGERELNVIRRKLEWSDSALEVIDVPDSRGPGNALLIEIGCEHVTDLFSGFGSQGIRAEAVAEEAARDARRYLQAEVPVGEYLADQLLLPLSIAGRGQFLTLPLSLHSTTHVDLIRRFLEVSVAVEEVSPHACLVRIGE